jgi:hypothetical protein
MHGLMTQQLETLLHLATQVSVPLLRQLLSVALQHLSLLHHWVQQLSSEILLLEQLDMFTKSLSRMRLVTLQHQSLAKQ